MFKLLAAVATVVLTAAPATAVVTFYNDKASFDSATAGLSFTSDGFDNNITANSTGTITFDSGVTSTNVGGNPCCGDNGVPAGTYVNAVDGDGSIASVTVDWLFPKMVTAVGFDHFGAASDHLFLQVDGETSFVNPDGGDGFFGFVSSSAVMGLTFANATNSFNAFSLDNLKFSSGATDTTTTAVPLPATLPLLMAGFAAMGIARRKRG